MTEVRYDVQFRPEGGGEWMCMVDNCPDMETADWYARWSARAEASEGGRAEYRAVRVTTDVLWPVADTQGT